MSAELFHVIATIVLRQTAHGPIPLVPRYDGHERVWTAPMPYLFQRQIGGVLRVTSTGTILNNLRRRCQVIGETNPAFRGLHFTPYDCRRLFATDLATGQEWCEFEKHFDKRKVELGSCGRPCGTAANTSTMIGAAH